MGAYYPQSYNFYNNFAIVVDGADFSSMGLGTVTFLTPGSDTIGGRTYRTVTIGTQTWLAENLDFKFSGCAIGGTGHPTTPNAWYYNNDEATYGIDGIEKCGLLYNWFAVKLLNDNRNDLIPGWHVPTTSEFDTLFNAIGGNSTAGTVLKAKDNSIISGFPSGWNGNDDYDFSWLPNGRYTGSFQYIGTQGFLWTITEVSTGNSVSRYATTSASINLINSGKDNAVAIRLVKD